MSVLFFAISLPGAVRRQLERLQTGLPGVRWESPEKLHLTLRYLGQVESPQAALVNDAMQEVSAPPFELVLCGCGRFPPRGRPRALWVGVQDAAPLKILHSAVEGALSKLGFVPDEREFVPHVTLGRLRDPRRAQVEAFVQQHKNVRLPDFLVEHFTLYESLRSPAGSTYRIVRQFPLT